MSRLRWYDQLRERTRENIQYLALNAREHVHHYNDPALERILCDLAWYGDWHALHPLNGEDKDQPATYRGLWTLLRNAANDARPRAVSSAARAWVRQWSSYYFPNVWPFEPPKRRTRKIADHEIRLPYCPTDGGRSATPGLPKRKRWGDCVTRAIALATGTPYADIRARLIETARTIGWPKLKVETGVARPVWARLLEQMGWRPTECRKGKAKRSSTRMRLGDIPTTRTIVHIRRHLATVIDGVIHDLFDSSRQGSAVVYEYWTKKEVAHV